MVIAIDPGDIRKKYAKKMELLSKIYDGSEHEIGEGYHLCKIETPPPFKKCSFSPKTI